jgi:hypothetical protein
MTCHQVIHMEFDEYSIAIVQLQNFIDNLVLVPDLANTSTAVFRVHNLVSPLLQAIENPTLKDRFILIENHGWNTSQFTSHINTLDLTQDVELLMSLLYVF